MLAQRHRQGAVAGGLLTDHPSAKLLTISQLTASSMNQPQTLNKRARTAAEKQFRRGAILNAADVHFRDVGFEVFSMARLAKRAGVAKGTLYLYFETREEVLLALLHAKLERWVGELGTLLEPGLSDEAFVTALFDAAHEDLTLLPLLMRLDDVIEHNISMEHLIASKRALGRLIESLAGQVSTVLNLTVPQSIDLLIALSSLLIGTTRVDQGPALEDEALPDDVVQFIRAFSSKDTFVKNACRIIAGIRAEV